MNHSDGMAPSWIKNPRWMPSGRVSGSETAVACDGWNELAMKVTGAGSWLRRASVSAPAAPNRSVQRCHNQSGNEKRTGGGAEAALASRAGRSRSKRRSTALTNPRAAGGASSTLVWTAACGGTRIALNWARPSRRACRTSVCRCRRCPSGVRVRWSIQKSSRRRWRRVSSTRWWASDTSRGLSPATASASRLSAEWRIGFHRQRTAKAAERGVGPVEGVG